YAELRLGRPLFASTGITQLMLEHLNNTPNLAPLSGAEQRALLKALAKHADDRYPSCLAFATALVDAMPESLFSDESSGTTSALTPRAPEKPVPRADNPEHHTGVAESRRGLPAEPFRKPSVVGSTFVQAESPYVVGRPAKGDLFVGRNDVLRMVQANLSPQGAKNILVLRGQRRTGKTSVLLRLLETLPRETEGFYLPVFVDVQGMTMAANESEFFHLLAHHIWSHLRQHGVTVDRPAPEAFETSPLITFELTFL